MSAPLSPPGLPGDLTSRPLTAGDAAAVLELMRVASLHDEGDFSVDLEDIQADWQRPSLDLARDTVGIVDDGDLVAYGEVYKGRRAEVYVLPSARGRGIGTALLRWTWDVCRAHGGTLVGQTVPEVLTGAVELFEASGYRQLWTSWVLTLGASDAITAPVLPDSVTIRPFVAGSDELAAYRVIEDAFNEWPDRDPATFEDWAATTIRRPGFRPWQLLLAEEATDTGSRVVGACICPVSSGVAWVDQIAVERAARGRGLARALLVGAFEDARARGASTCELSTDSRTGALGLYEHVGMRVTKTYRHYAKEF